MAPARKALATASKLRRGLSTISAETGDDCFANCNSSSPPSGRGRIEIQQDDREVAVGQLVLGAVDVGDGGDVEAGLDEQLLQAAQHVRVAIHDQDVPRR